MPKPQVKDSIWTPTWVGPPPLWVIRTQNVGRSESAAATASHLDGDQPPTHPPVDSTNPQDCVLDIRSDRFKWVNSLSVCNLPETLLALLGVSPNTLGTVENQNVCEWFLSRYSLIDDTPTQFIQIECITWSQLSTYFIYIHIWGEGKVLRLLLVIRIRFWMNFPVSLPSQLEGDGSAFENIEFRKKWKENEPKV